ncbi:hypothetical protein ACIBG0_25155 [Nocardia sp. NPDC050630]|uniref:hypothetical protein n=1 Tax=Nocardia sp. NPDC050630 TaxID=3364321 RepID=UPI003794278B
MQKLENFRLRGIQRPVSSGGADSGLAARGSRITASVRRSTGFRECAEDMARIIERRGTDKAKRIAAALRAGAPEIRGGEKRSYSIVKAKGL